jgi:hypothetical protein
MNQAFLSFFPFLPVSEESGGAGPCPHPHARWASHSHIHCDLMEAAIGLASSSWTRVPTVSVEEEEGAFTLSPLAIM